jgi:WD40 repeat protein
MNRIDTVLAIAGVLSCVVLTAQTSTTPVAPAATVTLTHEITSLATVNKSSLVAAGLANGQVVLWNGSDPAPAVVLHPHPIRVVGLASSPDGREIWSLAFDGSLARTPAASGAGPAMKRLEIGAAPLRAAAFSADGALVATGDARGEIRVFDTATGVARQKIQGHRTELHYLAMRSTPPLLATASAEADLRIWDVTTGRQTASVDSDLAFFALAFSPRDGTLASGGVGRRLTLHAPATFKPVGTLALPAPRMVATLAWSPDGRRIAIGDLDDETLSKGGIQVVDAGTRSVIADLDTGRIPCTAITFAGNGMVVAGIGRDLRAWRIGPVTQ